MELSAGESGFRCIPYRIHRPDLPVVQTLFRPFSDVGHPHLLRDLLLHAVSDLASSDDDTSSLTQQRVIIHGIEASLDTPVQWLSEHFSHPDNFLHVCLLSKSWIGWFLLLLFSLWCCSNCIEYCDCGFVLSPVSTTRVNGPNWRVPGFHYKHGLFLLAELTGRQHSPCWRVMETGHPSTWAVNSGSGNRALIDVDEFGTETFVLYWTVKCYATILGSPHLRLS